MTKATRVDKRNARAKAKKISANKARTTPTVQNKKNFHKTLRGSKLNFDQVLTNATRDINNRKQVETTINSPADLLKGITQTTVEVFKIYSYITLVEALIRENVIQHSLVIDLKAVSLDLISIDKRVQRMAKLVEMGEEEAVFTEALDITTVLQNYSEELYAEVVRAGDHALVIEESLSRLSKEIEDGPDVKDPTITVLHNLAYQYLNKVKEESEANATPVPAEATEEVSAV